MMATENPADPQTWEFTSADRLFLQVIDRCHQLGIKVIMDYSWKSYRLRFLGIKRRTGKGCTIGICRLVRY